MKHIVSFSGGKDSTAMLLMMLEKNMPVDEIVFCDTGLEFPEMYEYIIKFEKYIDRKITIIKAEKNWDSWFYRVKQKGKHKGEIYGFPYTIGAWCNSRLKMVPINKYFNQQKEHIRYIGIAYNEPKRYERLKNNEVAPLYEWKITEDDVIKYLTDRNILNPLYAKFSRLGCWCCPKQSLQSLKVLRKEYPDLWNKLLEYDKYSPVSFKPNYTVKQLEERFRKEK